MRPRILFIPMNWGRGLGPLTDCLAIAEALKKTCEIAFVCRDEFTDFVSAAGYMTYPVVSTSAPKVINSEFYTDFPSFQGLGDEAVVRKTLIQEEQAISDFRANALFSWLQFTTPISAKQLGVPLASKANLPEHPGFVPPDFAVPIQPSKVEPLFNRLLSEARLPKVQTLWELSFLRSDLKIAPTIPEFEPLLANVPGLYFVGHLLYSGFELADEPDWLSKWDESQPTVYVYLSAKQFRVGDFTQALANQFEGTEFQVVAAVGAHIPKSQIPPNTPNVRFEQLIPAHIMLSKSDVFISTGTRGSSWNALIHGVSLVTFPGNDVEMGLNAQNIERLGAGIRLPDEAFSDGRLLEAVRRVARPEYRKQARELGEKLESLGGPKYAAELLRRLALGELG